jgi:hypothetical protein
VRRRIAKISALEEIAALVPCAPPRLRLRSSDAPSPGAHLDVNWMLRRDIAGPNSHEPNQSLYRGN